MPVTLTVPHFISIVRASVQVYLAADEALARSIRDRGVILPDARIPLQGGDHDDLAEAIEDDINGFKTKLGDEGMRDWNAYLESRGHGHMDAAAQAEALLPFQKRWAQLEAPDEPEAVLDERLAQHRIEQWKKSSSNAPLLPVEEFAVEFATIALDFVGSNPSVLRVGSDAERIIGSFAGTVETILSNTAFSTRKDLGKRLLGSMLRAGLQTLNDERAMLVDEEHLQVLIQRTTLPILEELERLSGQPGKQLNFERFALNLVGPLSEAVFGVLTEHQKAFLGSRFDTEDAAGKVVNALLMTASEGALNNVLLGPDKTNLKAAGLRLFTSVASVVAQHPELLIDGTDTVDDFAKELLGKAAQAVTEAERIDNDLGLEIVAIGLDTLSSNVPGLVRVGSGVNAGAAWESVVEKTLQSVLGTLSEAVLGDRKLMEILTRQDLVDLSLIFFEQVAKTPHMVSGEVPELDAVIRTIARLKLDKNGDLLTQDDWFKVAAVAVTEASRNPGRLFRRFLTSDGREYTLGERLVSELMKAAAVSMTQDARGANVLMGETLRIAIETGLEAISADTVAGHVILSNEGRIVQLANEISVVVAQKEGDLFRYGSKEWLALWRKLLPELLTAGTDIGLATIKLPDANGGLRGTATVAGQARIETALHDEVTA